MSYGSNANMHNDTNHEDDNAVHEKINSETKDNNNKSNAASKKKTEI